jgi:hypothetical protein
MPLSVRAQYNRKCPIISSSCYNSSLVILLVIRTKVKVTMRLTISQSVSLGVEAHLGLMTRYLLLFDNYGLVFVGGPLWREDGCLLYMLVALASAVILGSESLGTRDHILLSDLRLPFSSPPTSRRVTVEVFQPASTRVAYALGSSLYSPGADPTENSLQQSLYFCRRVFTDPLPRNGSHHRCSIVTWMYLAGVT